ncbi:MAG: hypothetical protein Q6373_003505, partial [Candidatus Sigynarchaeota archaeon]
MKETGEMPAMKEKNKLSAFFAKKSTIPLILYASLAFVYYFLASFLYGIAQAIISVFFDLFLSFFFGFLIFG